MTWEQWWVGYYDSVSRRRVVGQAEKMMREVRPKSMARFAAMGNSIKPETTKPSKKKVVEDDGRQRKIA